jgi:hypothetical protein
VRERERGGEEKEEREKRGSWRRERGIRGERERGRERNEEKERCFVPSLTPEDLELGLSSVTTVSVKVLHAQVDKNLSIASYKAE